MSVAMIGLICSVLSIVLALIALILINEGK